jgi:UDP-N-acetylmuramate dehydrogenase
MFIEYDTLQELKSLVREYDLKNQLYLHIGGGSNLLFIHDFEGLVLHSRIQGIEIVDNSDTFVLLRVGAGVNWDDFVIYCVSQ